jgi:tetratricopeptide (TPR) repeat protein
MRVRGILGSALAAALCVAAPVIAQPAAPAPAATTADALAADQRAVMEAVQAINSTRGYGALASHVPALKDIHQKAPADTPPGSPAAEVYGAAALLLAAFANELKRYGEAAPYGERGLQLLPDHAGLVTETATAYVGLKKHPEALKVLDAWLARAPQPDTLDRARVLRTKGFSLIELNRLDEAQAAFEASLKLEPDHRGAMNELTYIAGLRKGKAPSGAATTTYGKAKAGDYGGARSN